MEKAGPTSCSSKFRTTDRNPRTTKVRNHGRRGEREGGGEGEGTEEGETETVKVVKVEEGRVEKAGRRIGIDTERKTREKEKGKREGETVTEKEGKKRERRTETQREGRGGEIRKRLIRSRYEGSRIKCIILYSGCHLVKFTNSIELLTTRSIRQKN
jgi:hypothetical protein